MMIIFKRRNKSIERRGIALDSRFLYTIELPYQMGIAKVWLKDVEFDNVQDKITIVLQGNIVR